MRIAATLLSALLLSSAAGTARAAESYDGCQYTVTSLPAVLTSQGVWCMKADLATNLTSGAAITVGTNNVTLDCNHFKLGGLAAGVGTQTIGVLTDGRTNTVVRHCSIRGFLYGIRELNGYGHVFEDNRLDGNTTIGIYLTGQSSVVRRNRVLDTGGSTVYPTSAFGIATALDSDVLDNIVESVAPAATDAPAYGIFTQFSTSATISGNRIRGLSPTGTGSAFGIFNWESGHVAVDGNFVLGDGFAGSAIRCTGNDGTASANVIAGFTLAVENCLSIDNRINPN